MLSRHAFVLCTLAAVLLVSGGSSRADMLVASSATNEVLRYDQNTGAYLGVFASHERLNRPYAMTFGPDGKLYVSSNNFYTDPVTPFAALRFDGQSGAFIDEFVHPSSPITGMTFDDDGHLYVAATGGVLRYDGTSGAFIDNFAPGAPWTGELKFGPDGNLYVTSWLHDQVYRFNGTTGASMGVFASGGGLDSPEHLVFGPDGNLYVSSFGTDSVLRYNGATGAFMGTFASGGGMFGPAGLAFGPDGNLYVNLREPVNKVLRYNGMTGAFIDEFVSGGRLTAPISILFTPDSAVPEPTSLALCSVGALGLMFGGLRRRRKQLAAAA